MTNYTITEEQIDEVCLAVSNVMKGETSAENCTFPTACVREGIAAGLSPQEISANCYKSVINNPLLTAFSAVKSGTSIHNMAQFMCGEVLNQLTPYVTADPIV